MKRTPQQQTQSKKFYTVLVALPVSGLSRSGRYPIPSNWQSGALPESERTGFGSYVRFSWVTASDATGAGEVAAQVLYLRLKQERSAVGAGQTGASLLSGYFGTWRVLARVESGDAAGTGGGEIDDASAGVFGDVTDGASAGTSDDYAAFDLVAKPNGLYYKTPTSLQLLICASANPEKDLPISPWVHLPQSQPGELRAKVGAGTGTGAGTAGHGSGVGGDSGASGGTNGGTSGGSPYSSYASYRAKERARNIEALGLSQHASWEEELTALEALTAKRRRELRLSPQTNYVVENRLEARRRLRKLHGEGYVESHKYEIDKEVGRVDEERRAEALRIQNRTTQERRAARSRATKSKRDRQRMLRWGTYFFFALGLGLLMSVFGHCSDDTSASVLVGLWGLG